MSEIVDFYRGRAPDYMGRTLVWLLESSDDHLEWSHNYIQILFPLREESLFNWNAPLLDDASVAAFHTDEKLRANLTRSFERMLTFYGFRHDSETGKVVRSEDFPERARNWLDPFNHNYRRITRILKSLRTLALAELAWAFYDALAALYAEHRDA